MNTADRWRRLHDLFRFPDRVSVRLIRGHTWMTDKVVLLDATAFGVASDISPGYWSLRRSERPRKAENGHVVHEAGMDKMIAKLSPGPWTPLAETAWAVLCREGPGELLYQVGTRHHVLLSHQVLQGWRRAADRHSLVFERAYRQPVVRVVLQKPEDPIGKVPASEVLVGWIVPYAIRAHPFPAEVAFAIDDPPAIGQQSRKMGREWARLEPGLQGRLLTFGGGGADAYAWVDVRKEP